MSAIKAKKKTDLTKVTVAPPAPDRSSVDSTTPIDISILPFTQMNLQKWGPWLHSRMEEFWPHLTSMNYHGFILQQINNGSLFLYASRAIMLATVARETLEPRPIVDIEFGFKFEPEDEDQNKDIRLLIRRVEDWARGQGARYVRVKHPERIDMTLSRTEEALWADKVEIFMKDLDV